MSKYIGSNAPYGLHEKQDFTPTSGQTDFSLNYKVGYSTSILVVYKCAGISKVLEPGVDYNLVDGGTKIRLTFDPYNSDAYEEKIYVIYLGKELSVPVPLEKQPVLIQKTGLTGNIPITEDVVLTPQGIIVFKNGTQLRHTTDYSISVDGNELVLSQAAVPTDLFDIHVIGGLQRSTLVPIQNNSITSEQLKSHIITSEKLDLRHVSYIPTVSALGNLQIQSTSVGIAEATYLIQGNKNSISGAPVKVRIKFNATLSGSRDVAVRFSLPDLLPNISTVIGGNVTITNSSSIESGILTWGAVDAVDIRRQFGVSFDLGIHTFEASFEYITKE